MRCWAWLRIVAGVVLVASVAVACGSDDGDDPDATSSSTSVPSAEPSGPNPFAGTTAFCEQYRAPSGTRRASSPGIGADTITVVDGSTDPDNARRNNQTAVPNEAIYQALFDEINDCGGINGRKIVLERVMYNSSAPDVVGHATANCLKATEDFEAFLIVNSTTSSVFPRCAAVDHDSIVMTGNSGLFNTDDVVDSKGRLLSVYAGAEEVAKAFVTYAVEESLFEDHKVMVLGVERTPSTAADLAAQFVDPLKEAGVDAYLEVLPCIAASNCRAQIGATVARAKSRGVDRILLSQQMVTGVIGVLYKNMQEQKLRAELTGPVAQVIHNDAVMPAQLSDAGEAGAAYAAEVGVTAWSPDDYTMVGAWRVGYGLSSFGKLCLDTLNRRMRNDPPWTYSEEYFKNGYWTVGARACREVRGIAKALWSLGNEVTTERAVTALSKVRPEQTDMVPLFHQRLWYTLSDMTPKYLAPLRYHYPCPDVTPATACMLPSEKPIKPHPVG